MISITTKSSFTRAKSEQEMIRVAWWSRWEVPSAGYDSSEQLWSHRHTTSKEPLRGLKGWIYKALFNK